ncbi:hypothetical protein [Paraliobacillus zengyii]|uniref:hypothetical protein n=1 Tax=Paraliobacillus zengyii TaxID=2213194 RepID=UPI000DD2CA43|nr:hypothetical protein [Paraliobacillus zengyii]
MKLNFVDEEIIELLKEQRELWSDKHDYTLKKFLERYFEEIDYIYPKQLLNGDSNKGMTTFYVFSNKKLYIISRNQRAFQMEFINADIEKILLFETGNNNGKKFELEIKHKDIDDSIVLNHGDCDANWVLDFKEIAQNIYKYLT